MPESLPTTRDAAPSRFRGAVTTILLIALSDHDRQGHLRAPMELGHAPSPDVTQRSR